MERNEKKIFKQRNHTSPTGFLVNNQTITNPSDMVNALKYFAEVFVDT